MQALVTQTGQHVLLRLCRSIHYVLQNAEIGHSHAIDILDQNMNAKIHDQIV
jgi:hypothetical protein